MTPLPDKLRAALRETADKIPAEAPPLRLSPRQAARSNAHGRRGPRPGWRAWTAPLASAALILVVVAVSLALTHGARGPQPPPDASPAGVPPYYVALTVPGTGTDVYSGDATAAEVRATATGAVLARVTVPKPYVHFAGVTAAADDRTFVLVAEEKSDPPASAQQYTRQYGAHGYYQPSRFYLLHFDPASGRASLRALPAAFIPANDEVHDMALSPDSTLLAADIGGDLFQGNRLHVFDLATGSVRIWNGSGGLGFGGTNVDALSWTADGKYLAFVGSGPYPSPSEVRLLDVTAPGSDLLANSKPVTGLPPGDGMNMPMWRGAIVTPDGRTVVIVEELATSTGPVRVRDRLLECSVTTGQVTAILNDLNVLAGYQYEQVMYANATGSVLVVSGVRKGSTAGTLRGDAYTPIPWSAHTVTAAW